MRELIRVWRGIAAMICWVSVLTSGVAFAEPVDPIDQKKNSSPELSVVLGKDAGVGIEFGSARVALHGYAWLRAQSESRVGDETDLAASVPVGRLFLTGDLLDGKLGFFAQPEFAGGSTRLLDLFAEWRFSPAMVLRLGQFRTPFSRAFITPLTNLELPTRGLVIDQFGLGRDTGGMLSGLLGQGRVHYDLAVVNGAEINDLDGNRDAPSVIGRVELRFGDPVPYNQAPSLELSNPKGVAIGFGGAYAKKAIRDTSGTSSEHLANAAADVAWMYGPLSVRAEAFYRSAHGSPRVAHAYGAYVQGGVFLMPRLLEAGGRVGWLSDGPDAGSYEAFLAGYLNSMGESYGHHLKLILGYRYDTAASFPADRGDAHVARLQAQLFF